MLDNEAIHDNVASEISAITNKGTIAAGDFILLEDSAASNVKKHTLFSELEAVISHDRITGVSSDDHHAQAHTVASHSDTTATGAETETLTDGSDADALHTHGAIQTTEEVQDIIGAMVAGNTETLIAVTYNDATGKLNFVVAESSISHDNIAGVSINDHHARDHAASHAENAADEIVAEGLGATSVDVSTNLKPDGTGGVEFVDSDHADLANVTTDQHHAQAHTIASHSDTTGTGAELNELTDASVTTLHSHAGGGGGASVFSELMLIGA